jgi:lipid-A-disaccharide synthase
MRPLLVVAGEASGDQLGAPLLEELKRRRPDLRLVGIGGKGMSPFLDRKLADVGDLSVMGLVEVVRHLPRLNRIFNDVLALARDEGVGGALLIDYPGFNLRLAKALRKGLPEARLHQYVCPQVWAWKKGRIPDLGRTLDVLYCLFDFEPALFKDFPVEAVCLGHPLVDVVRPEMDRAAFFEQNRLDPALRTVALLPGSRHGEVQRLLPPLAGLARAWDADPARERLQWVLPLAPTLDESWVQAFLEGTSIRIVKGCGFAARAHADAALVASGTATLETALLGTPFAVAYRFHPLTYRLGRMLVKIPHFSLPNIVAGREVVRELLQGEVTPPVLADVLEKLLDPIAGPALRAELGTLRPRLGAPGAAGRVAEHLLLGLGDGAD